MPCNFFDVRPKEERSLMYGRDAELGDIDKQLGAHFWTLITGPRRIGKTSILKVVSKERGGEFFDCSTCTKVGDLGNRLIDRVGRRFKTKFSVDLKVIKADFEKQPMRTLEQFLGELPDIVIALDEVQNMNDPTFTKLLSVAYNESKVRFMFSGTATGMMKRLANAPAMLGRPTQQVEIEPFEDTTSKGFLETGFVKCGIGYKETEVDESVKAFGGIPGWLSYYGAKRSQGINHERAIKEVRRNAKGVLDEELGNLGNLESAIVRAIASFDTSGTWSELKALSRVYYGSQPDDKSLKRSIDSLVGMRLIRKSGGKYELVDRMYKIIRE